MSEADRRDDHKADLHRYLRVAREALVWKLEGVSEYDARRPLVPTGTNLLGLVKHVATVESGYLGDVMGRPYPEARPWIGDDAEPDADMWATAEEPRAEIVAFYQRVWVHADATIEALALDAPGHVPWWGERGAVTLQLMLVHMIAETNRHCGHADILRELIDGAAGLRADNDNLAPGGRERWAEHRERLERAARRASGIGR